MNTENLQMYFLVVSISVVILVALGVFSALLGF